MTKSLIQFSLTPKGVSESLTVTFLTFRQGAFDLGTFHYNSLQVWCKIIKGFFCKNNSIFLFLTPLITMFITWQLYEWTISIGVYYVFWTWAHQVQCSRTQQFLGRNVYFTPDSNTFPLIHFTMDVNHPDPSLKLTPRVHKSSPNALRKHPQSTYPRRRPLTPSRNWEWTPLNLRNTEDERLCPVLPEVGQLLFLQKFPVFSQYEILRTITCANKNNPREYFGICKVPQKSSV